MRRLCACTRRSALAVLAAARRAPCATRAKAAPAEHREFIAAAFRMKDEAVRAGDQAYGAVVVKDGRIIGFGPSRVVLKKDWTAHAEREAIREAQARLGRSDLSGCILYSIVAAVLRMRAAAAERQYRPHDPSAARRPTPASRGRSARMIDHVSIAVRDLAACGRFYDAVLATLGYDQMIVTRPAPSASARNIRSSG